VSMKFSQIAAEVYIPNDADVNDALRQTTDLCIGAHHDDVEIMAYGPIAQCYGNTERHFTGVIVTDGAGSPRSGIYANHSDEQMKHIRLTEQKTAAKIGRYSAQVMLSHPSSNVKNPANTDVANELKEILLKTQPDVVYTHNFADKHDTHVAVALHVVRILREMPPEARPQKVVALEVWRSLDWLCDDDKIIHDTAAFPNLASTLVGVYDSQISGGKRYDNAALGRRLANATFFASHNVDDYESCSFGMDITELIHSDKCPIDFMNEYIMRFNSEVQQRIAKFL